MEKMETGCDIVSHEDVRLRSSPQGTRDKPENVRVGD